MGAMGPPGGGRNPITARLLRHFHFIAFPEMEDDAKVILRQFLQRLCIKLGGGGGENRQKLRFSSGIFCKGCRKPLSGKWLKKYQRKGIIHLRLVGHVKAWPLAAAAQILSNFDTPNSRPHLSGLKLTLRVACGGGLPGPFTVVTFHREERARGRTVRIDSRPCWQ